MGRACTNSLALTAIICSPRCRRFFRSFARGCYRRGTLATATGPRILPHDVDTIKLKEAMRYRAANIARRVANGEEESAEATSVIESSLPHSGHESSSEFEFRKTGVDTSFASGGKALQAGPVASFDAIGEPIAGKVACDF